MRPPPYFDVVRTEASRRWDQLEADPELAAPWHQLFSQVQSPRHVLSELLQNADDAGATEAFAELTDGVFTFGHNGRDFTEEEFRSLCRFGYSNKRVLHTIGFRGVGFKSTFSLGSVVELRTPTLAVAFVSRRFTEPRWIEGARAGARLTTVRIELSDAKRERELRRNLGTWIASPLSLLFFRNVTRFRVGEDEIRWLVRGAGPLADSEWIELEGSDDGRLLRIRSQPEPLPEEAVDEIRRERLLTEGEGFDLPPASVEIVLGAPSRLYVVLPTEVDVELPFACNAPFVQDPARDRIKDPVLSATNHCLLNRAGALAAAAMLAWLGNEKLPMPDRAAAYGLLPDPEGDEKTDSLPSACRRIVRESFVDGVENEAFLLTDEGALVPSERSFILPVELCDVWSPTQASKLFDPLGRPPLSRFVAESARDVLEAHGFSHRVPESSVVRPLRSKIVPRPTSWARLLDLWVFLAPLLPAHASFTTSSGLRIVPVPDSASLTSADRVVNLQGKVKSLSADDMRFVSEHAKVVDPAWLRYLRRADRGHEGDREIALTLLARLGLDQQSGVSKLINRVAGSVFSATRVTRRDAVHVAHLAARVNAKVTLGSSFEFITIDGHRRDADGTLFVDLDSSLGSLLSDKWMRSRVLHSAYSKPSSTCSQDQWRTWVMSANAPLLVAPPLEARRERIRGRERVATEARRRGHPGDLDFPYTSHDFRLDDWDFNPELYEHWRDRSERDPDVWARIIESVMRADTWQEALGSQVIHCATNGHERSIAGALSPSWILGFRDRPCILDTHGRPTVPMNLLRRTKATNPLLDIEPFVHPDLDTESATRLLTALGVQSKPAGPGAILDRIRALAGADNVPIGELEKLYERLDGLAETANTADLAEIKKALFTERLILSDDRQWHLGAFVFLSTDEEDAPGAPVVLESVRDLALWKRIGIPIRPTVEHAVTWLESLSSSQGVDPNDVGRVRALLRRYPERIWAQLGHWLTLADEWVPVDSAAYALTPGTHLDPQSLHDWVTRETLDFRGLPAELVSRPPFSETRPVVSELEWRLSDDARRFERRRKPWLECLGRELARVRLATPEETDHTRSLADRLARTRWVEEEAFRCCLRQRQARRHTAGGQRGLDQ